MQSIAAQRPAAPAAPMPLKRWSVGALAALIALATLWFILCWQLSGEWSLNEQYNYGWFVPFFALYLFWLRWEDQPPLEIPNPKSQIRNHRVAAIIAALVGFAALLLLLPVRLFEIGNPDWRPLSWVHASIVATLTLLYVWHRGGTLWLRHFAFPILFIFVAVPWVTPIEVPVVQGLMQIVAAIASEIAALFGIPAHLEGNLIRIPNGLVGVNEACSGVRSLQTSLMIGLLFGELKRLSILRRVVLIVGAVAIAFVGNCARAFFLVWIAETKNIAAVDQWHDLAGYSIVAAVFVGSLVLATVLGRSRPGLPPWPKRSGVAGPPSPSLRRGRQNWGFLPASYLVAALCWVAFTEIASEAWYRSHERHLAPVARWTVRWPKDAPGFREIKIEEAVRANLRYDDGHETVWNTLFPIPKGFEATAQTAAAKCTLFFFSWKPGSTSVVRARAHRPDICLPNVGWHQISDRGVAQYAVERGFSVPFRHVAFVHRRSGAIAHTFFCLQEDELHPTEPRPDLQISNGFQPRADWSFRGRARVVFNGVRNLGQQVMELIFVSSPEVDDAAAERKFVELVPKLIKVEDEK